MPEKIAANNSELKTWVEMPAETDFTIQNLPFGMFKTKNISHRAGVAIGNKLVDLAALFQKGYLKDLPFTADDFSAPYLNPVIEKGKQATRQIRNRVSELLQNTNQELQSKPEDVAEILLNQDDVEMLLPVRIGDYTDFYSSEQHAFNVGSMFRDPENALLPNWKHIPVGYHGRSSSIVVSGTDIYRPKGQTKSPEQQNPVFGPTKMLDFELEMAFITYNGKPLGESVSTDEAEDYIFGMVIFNDWSARDIQSWEYVPLGPFLAKNFASSISPWIVTLDALEPYRTAGPKQEPKVLPYLEYTGKKHLNISLEVWLETAETRAEKICTSNYSNLYWNMNQQLAHHTINGCNINAGDCLASGTISGKETGSFGSMLEISWKGSRPLKLNNGLTRSFIEDGDTVIMKAHCEKEGIRVGFGQVRTKVLPAKSN